MEKLKYGYYKIDIGFHTVAEYDIVGWRRIGSDELLDMEDFEIVCFLFDPFL